MFSNPRAEPLLANNTQSSSLNNHTLSPLATIPSPVTGLMATYLTKDQLELKNDFTKFPADPAQLDLIIPAPPQEEKDFKPNAYRCMSFHALNCILEICCDPKDHNGPDLLFICLCHLICLPITTPLACCGLFADYHRINKRNQNIREANNIYNSYETNFGVAHARAPAQQRMI